MKPLESCYWLQGYFEIKGQKTLGRREIKIIEEHLGLVFTKSTGTRKRPRSCVKEPTYCADRPRCSSEEPVC